MNIETTQYYDEFLRYYKMVNTQQIEYNLGTIDYKDSSVDDDLMKNVHPSDDYIISRNNITAKQYMEL